MGDGVPGLAGYFSQEVCKIYGMGRVPRVKNKNSLKYEVRYLYLRALLKTDAALLTTARRPRRDGQTPKLQTQTLDRLGGAHRAGGYTRAWRRWRLCCVARVPR